MDGDEPIATLGEYITGAWDLHSVSSEFLRQVMRAGAQWAFTEVKTFAEKKAK